MRLISLRPAIIASLISLALSVLAASTVFANGGGTSFP
jgi:hypothetical protein